MCSKVEFEEFYKGFGASSPLVSVVDVGGMKEAADAKVRGQCSSQSVPLLALPLTFNLIEITKMFAFFPQTKAIYFGGT